MVAATLAQFIGCTNSRATATQTATPTALGVALRGCAIVPRPHAACGGPQPPFSSFVPQPGDSSDCERDACGVPRIMADDMSWQSEATSICAGETSRTRRRG